MSGLTGSSRRAMLAALGGATALTLAPASAMAKPGKRKKGKKRKTLIGYCVGGNPNIQYAAVGPHKINVTWEVRCMDLRNHPATSAGVFNVGADRTATSRSMGSQLLRTIAPGVFGVPPSQASRIKIELF